MQSINFEEIDVLKIFDYYFIKKYFYKIFEIMVDRFKQFDMVFVDLFSILFVFFLIFRYKYLKNFKN